MNVGSAAVNKRRLIGPLMISFDPSSLMLPTHGASAPVRFASRRGTEVHFPFIHSRRFRLIWVTR